MEYYKSFYVEAQELVNKLPEEQSELYKRHFVPIPLEKFSGMIGNLDGGSAEETALNSLSKELFDKLGIKFDAIFGSTRDIVHNGAFVKVIGYSELTEEHISNKMFKSADDRLVAFIHATSKNIIFIDVPDEATVSLNLLFANIEKPLSAQIIINVGKNAKLNILEWHASKTKETSMSAVMHEIRVGAYSLAEIDVIHNEDPNTYVVGFSRGAVGDSGNLKVNYIYNGGLSTKAKNEIRAVDYSARSQVMEMVLGSGQQKFDLSTVIANVGRGTISDLESKAALMDNAVCLLKGFADVGENAANSLSFVNERGILLSKEAYMSSIPGMSIKNSNVKATHSSATAPVDENSLFYLMSRGADKTMAEKLLITGFFSSSIGKIQNPLVRTAVGSLVNEKVNKKTFGDIPDADTRGMWFDSPTAEGGDIFQGHYKYREVK